MVHVLGDVAVERGEELHGDKEHVEQHGVGDDLGEFLDRFLAGIEIGQLAHDEREQNQKRGARGEGRGQETRRQNRGQPERTGRETGVEKRRDGVDADGPRNRQNDDGLDPLRRRLTATLRAQRHPRDQDVEHQVAAEGHRVPEHHGVGRRVEKDVHDPVRSSHVDEDEGHAHDDRRDGEELAENGHLAERLVVVEIVGQDHHHRRRGDTDQEGELGDVEPPNHVPAHAGDGQTGGKLPEPADAAGADHHEEKRDPCPVGAVSSECLLKHGRPLPSPRRPPPVRSPATSAGHR